MRVVDFLMIMRNQPQERPYQGIYLLKKEREIPLHKVWLDKTGDVILNFDLSKKLSMEELTIFLMMHREHLIYYQFECQKYPIYGLKEKANRLIL